MKKIKIRFSTRIGLALCAFLFVFRNSKDLDEPESGDNFKFVIEGYVK